MTYLLAPGTYKPSSVPVDFDITQQRVKFRGNPVGFTFEKYNFRIGSARTECREDIWNIVLIVTVWSDCADVRRAIIGDNHTTLSHSTDREEE